MSYEKKGSGLTFQQRIDEHYSKQLYIEDEIPEYTNENAKVVKANLIKTIEETLKNPKYQDKDFYIMILYGIEVAAKAPRTWIFSKFAAPTPSYKQTVYKYHRHGDLEYLWTVPSLRRVNDIVNNPNKYLKNPESRGLAINSLMFASGKLLELAKRLNGDKIDLVLKLEYEKPVYHEYTVG